MIKVENLKLSFGKNEVLKGINFRKRTGNKYYRTEWIWEIDIFTKS